MKRPHSTYADACPWMTEDNLGTAEFVRSDEAGAWKIAKFSWDNVVAIRSCGETKQFASDDDARKYVRDRSIEALLSYVFGEAREGWNRAVAALQAGTP